MRIISGEEAGSKSSSLGMCYAPHSQPSRRARCRFISSTLSSAWLRPGVTSETFLLERCIIDMNKWHDTEVWSPPMRGFSNITAQQVLLSRLVYAVILLLWNESRSLLNLLPYFTQLAEQKGTLCAQTKTLSLFCCQWSRAKWFLGLPNWKKWIKCLSLNSSSAILFGPWIKPKQINTPARGSLSRQNSIIDSKTAASQLLCDQSDAIALQPHCVLDASPQLRPSKTTNTSFWNAIKAPEIRLHSRKPGPKEEGRREVGGPAWPVLEVKHQFARWASSEIPSATVSERRSIRFISWKNSVCPFLGIFFQLQEAGGARRGWIMLCTVLTFWPPSPPWLCPTFSTPPTGSPLMWQLLFSDRWAHRFSFSSLCRLRRKNRCWDWTPSSCEWPRKVLFRQLAGEPGDEGSFNGALH